MKNLSKNQNKYLSDYILDDNYIFIDIRNSNSYNGWILNNEIFSGHIKGALNFDCNWLDRLSLINFLEENSISPKKNLILCYNDLNQLEVIINYLNKTDYKNFISIDMRDLSATDKKYIINYKNFSSLIPAQEIINLETKDKISEYKIFHTGFGTEEESSKEGHINGSVYINTDEIEPPPLWKLGTDEILYKFAEKYALSTNDKIIVSSWNQLASFRVATTLLHIGIKNVQVLNGGLNSLKELSYKFETKSNYIKSQKRLNYKITNDSNVILSTEKLKTKLLEEDFTLVDNRSWLEHIGVISGYDYYKKKSRVPNSVYGYAGINGPQSLEYYRNIDNTMISKDFIEKLWASTGIKTTNTLAFMCGSGWRASEVYFYAYVLGYTNILLYSDGWIGWSRDDSNPTETGIPSYGTKSLIIK